MSFCKLRTCAVLAFIGTFGICISSLHAAAFVQAGLFRGAGGDDSHRAQAGGLVPGFAPQTTTFNRWEQAQITFSFTPGFTSQFGAVGKQSVRDALATWQSEQFTLAGGLHGTTIGRSMNVGPDYPLWTQNGPVDFQSLALHEIGHAIGLHHVDEASNLYPGAQVATDNFNMVGGAFVKAAIPNPLMTFNDGPNGGGNYDNTKRHPVMWSTLGFYNVYRTLTNDDIYALQYMYDDIQIPGNGTAHADGPIFGNAAGQNVAERLNFSEVGAAGNIVFGVDSTQGSLANTVFASAAKGGLDNYDVITSATINFLPEPGSAVTVLISLSMILVRKRR